METRNLPLRILYTINSSPQYILARSCSAVPVVLVPPVQTTSHHDKSAINAERRPEFGTASLKTCFDAIYRSSPELLQDSSRDFSVYVLDPLESNSAPAPVNISNTTSGLQEFRTDPGPERSCGVAVGLGLMSWALHADEKDSVAVSGTLTKLGTGQEVLEVIFALRETAAMHKTSLPAALRSWGLPPEPSSRLSQGHAPNSNRESKHSSEPSTSAASSSYPVSTAITSSQTSENLQRHDAHSTHSARYSIQSLSEPSSLTRSTSYLGQIPHTVDATTLATIASIQMRSHHKAAKSKPKKPAKPPFINCENSEADRLLLTENVYVGPVKKKGRPANATASGSVSNNSTENITTMGDSKTPPTIADSENPPMIRPTGTVESSISLDISFPSQSQACKAKSSKASPAQASASLPFVSTPLIRSPRDPEPPTLLEILASLSTTPSTNDPNVQNAALLAALHAIDSASGSSAPSEKAPNPGLVNALRDLLYAVSQKGPPLSTAEPNTSQHPPNTHNRTHSPDNDVVLLDKENVNPTAFRRRNERDGKLLATESPAPPGALGLVVTSGQSAEPPANNRSLGTRSNGSSNNTPVAPAPANASTNAIRRKRTLSDVMDERDSGKDKGKPRERELTERRDAHRYGHSSTKRTDLPTNRHYPRLMSDGVQPHRRGTNSYYRTGMEPWTSPPRQTDENSRLDSWRENSRQQPIIIHDSPQAPKISASSPVRSKSTQSQARRRYIVPAWARTETATQPRLSQEAQRALELAEERKKEEKEANRTKGANRIDKEKKKKQRLARSASPAWREASSCQDYPADATQITQRPPPIIVAKDCPVFAMTSAIQDRIAAFASPTTPSGSNLPQSSTNLDPPRTPPRQRHSDLFSPGEDGSLFTPMLKTPAANPRGSAHSPLHHTQRKVSTGSFNKEGNKMPSPREAKVEVQDGNDASAEESEEDIEEALNRELDTALRDVDISSGSLPSATGDVDMGNEIPPTWEDETSQVDGANDDVDDSDVESPKKQHWVGLPPSSPPPPTSPILMPQEEESDALSDDMELPAATSDAEPWHTDSEMTESSLSAQDVSYTSEELAEYFKDEDFTSLFPAAGNQPDFGSDAAEPGMDVFDQFTNHNAQSDGVDQSFGMNVDPGFDIFQNGLTGLDFTELWETFKPLVQDQSSSGADESASLDLGQNAQGQTLDMMSFELAEDLQALLSGCLM